MASNETTPAADPPDLLHGLFWVRSGAGWVNATPGQCADEIARLRAALRRHGGHTSGCRWRGGFDCNCGWEDLSRG